MSGKSPTGHPRDLTTEQILTHLAKRLDKSGECWEWTGARTKQGYGRVGMGGSEHYVHRLMYATCVGAIPPGMFICHHCDNPPCCNPDHLYAGTQAENLRDMHRRGRAVQNQTTGIRHHMAYLPPELIRAAVAEVRSGSTQTETAAKYGVSRGALRGWLLGIHRPDAQITPTESEAS